MKKSRFLALLMILLSIGLFSCSEEEDDDEPTPTTNNNNGGSSNTTPTINSPQFSDADAALIAVESVTKTMGLSITIGTAVATFNDGSGTLVDAGTVTVEGETMTQNSNNSYTYTASQTAPQGISFGQPIEWSISGSSAVTAFSENRTQAFPNVGDVSSAATVDKSDGYTLSVPNVSGADSVMFFVGNVSKTLGGNATTYTFSSAELSSLGNGSSIAQVAAFDIENKSINAKKVYFLTETVKQLSVTIQD